MAKSKDEFSVKETLRNVERTSTHQLNELERKRKELVNLYRSEEKIGVTVSPFYAPYLGSIVRQAVNGIIVEVPANGQTYEINKTHADHIIARIKRVDSMMDRQRRAADISRNLEHQPGELHI